MTPRLSIPPPVGIHRSTLNTSGAIVSDPLRRDSSDVSGRAALRFQPVNWAGRRNWGESAFDPEIGRPPGTSSTIRRDVGVFRVLAAPICPVARRLRHPAAASDPVAGRLPAGESPEDPVAPPFRWVRVGAVLSQPRFPAPKLRIFRSIGLCSHPDRLSEGRRTRSTWGDSASAGSKLDSCALASLAAGAARVCAQWPAEPRVTSWVPPPFAGLGSVNPRPLRRAHRLRPYTVA
jgi:hypothetical protein